MNKPYIDLEGFYPISSGLVEQFWALGVKVLGSKPGPYYMKLLTRKKWLTNLPAKQILSGAPLTTM